MPAWFFIALGAPLLWAVSNYIDKILVSRHFKQSSGALIIFSALMGAVAVPFIWIFNPAVFEITGINAVVMIISGVLAIFGLIPYFYALRRDDASLVVPIFQLIPVFTYILARIFLGETLTGQQIFAGILVILGAVGISIDFSKHHIRLKGVTFSLMLLSSVVLAVTQFLFKKVGIEETFWVTTFWAYIGYAVAAIILLVGVASYRHQFRSTITTHPRIVGINLVNELINIVGITLFTFASLLGPLALVSLVNGFQPLFVVIIGIMLTVWFPKVLQENITKQEITQKAIAIIIMLIGTFFLNQAI